MTHPKTVQSDWTFLGSTFRPSVDFGPWDTTEIGCGPGTSASDMNLVVSIKGSTAFVVGVLTLIPIHGAPPRWGIHSYPSPLDDRLEANKSKRGLERSQGPSPSPRLLGPKTATWPVWAQDLAITRIKLQNVKDICPHISVPHSWPEHQASPPTTRSKLATCHLVAVSGRRVPFRLGRTLAWSGVRSH